MRTIFVEYANSLYNLNYNTSLNMNLKTALKTEDDVKVGDTFQGVLKSRIEFFRVTNIIEEDFKYINKATGEISNGLNSVQQEDIVKITIGQSGSETSAVFTKIDPNYNK